MKNEPNDFFIALYNSLGKDPVNYPIILFNDVLWDFDVFDHPLEVIIELMANHCADISDTYDHFFAVDSRGNKLKFSRNIFLGKMEISFCYPSIITGIISLEELKVCIVTGCENAILNHIVEKEEGSQKLKAIEGMNSFKDLILFVKKEMLF